MKSLWPLEGNHPPSQNTKDLTSHPVERRARHARIGVEVHIVVEIHIVVDLPAPKAPDQARRRARAIENTNPSQLPPSVLTATQKMLLMQNFAGIAEVQ